jgi:6-pyruvoyltetrahydropterin/6-carboxytetrahydropterin synthase
MVYLTKQMSFSASHRLYNSNLSEEENYKIYNNCANINGHGHNFKLEVSVVGEPDPITGYVINLKELKNIIQKEIIDIVDHKNLNLDVPQLANTIPTSENLIILFWNLLADKFANATLAKIKLSESDTSWVEYYGQ